MLDENELTLFADRAPDGYMTREQRKALLSLAPSRMQWESPKARESLCEAAFAAGYDAAITRVLMLASPPTTGRRWSRERK